MWTDSAARANVVGMTKHANGSTNGLPAYLTTREVAERLRQPEGTLRYWRCKGVGPPSFKAGRRVLYPSELLLEWEAQQLAAQQH